MQPLQDTYKAFLSLVRLGIGHYSDRLPESVDWIAIKELAVEQGLTAIVLDGIEKARNLNSNLNLSHAVLLEWIGEVVQNYEGRYQQYEKAIAELAGFYNQHDFKMMVLKGYACSLDWQKPEHRPCGDIDIWQFGQQKDADAVLACEKGIKVDTSEHHHTTFYWCDFMVENHYDFINTHRHYSHQGLELIFKELGSEANLNENHNHNTAGKLIPYVEVRGEKIYLPSPNLHALFLVRHALNHFASVGINLRQVLDWAFFAEKHTKEIDWKWLTGMLEKYHMMDFYNCLNAICVDDLGFEAGIFHGIQFNPDLKEKVLADILSPECEVKTGVKNRLQRWKANRWKHHLCYKENAWAAFWCGVWSHILKPSSLLKKS